MTATTDLAARAAISDVVNLYCHAIDRRQWEEIGHCFHADATYRFGAIDGTWQEFVAVAKAIIDPTRITHHQTGNMLFRLSANAADTETYFTAYHRIAADAPGDAVFPGTGVEYDVVLAGRYVDRFECRDGEWRIAHRTGVTDWRRDTPAADSGLFAQPPDWRGSIGSDDPGFAVIL